MSTIIPIVDSNNNHLFDLTNSNKSKKKVTFTSENQYNNFNGEISRSQKYKSLPITPIKSININKPYQCIHIDSYYNRSYSNHYYHRVTIPPAPTTNVTTTSINTIDRDNPFRPDSVLAKEAAEDAKKYKYKSAFDTSSRSLNDSSTLSSTFNKTNLDQSKLQSTPSSPNYTNQSLNSSQAQQTVLNEQILTNGHQENTPPTTTTTSTTQQKQNGDDSKAKNKTSNKDKSKVNTKKDKKTQKKRGCLIS